MLNPNHKFSFWLVLLDMSLANVNRELTSQRWCDRRLFSICPSTTINGYSIYLLTFRVGARGKCPIYV